MYIILVGVSYLIQLYTSIATQLYYFFIWLVPESGGCYKRYAPHIYYYPLPCPQIPRGERRSTCFPHFRALRRGRARELLGVLRGVQMQECRVGKAYYNTLINLTLIASINVHTVWPWLIDVSTFMRVSTRDLDKGYFTHEVSKFINFLASLCSRLTQPYQQHCSSQKCGGFSTSPPRLPPVWTSYLNHPNISSLLLKPLISFFLVIWWLQHFCVIDRQWEIVINFS